MQSTRGPCPAPEPAPWSERPPAPHCDPRGSERPPGLISQHRPSPSSPRPGATARPRAQARRQGLSPAGKAVPAAAEGRARARASVTNALRVLLRRPRRLTEDSCSRPLPTRLCSQTGGDRSRKPGGRSPKGGQRGAARARRRPGGHGEAAALSSRRQRSRKRRAPRACAPRPAPPRPHVTWGDAPVAPGSRLLAPRGNASRAAPGSGPARRAPGDALPAGAAARRGPPCGLRARCARLRERGLGGSRERGARGLGGGRPCRPCPSVLRGRLTPEARLRRRGGRLRPARRGHPAGERAEARGREGRAAPGPG